MALNNHNLAHEYGIQNNMTFNRYRTLEYKDLNN